LIFNKHGLEILRSNPFLKATMLAVSLLQFFALYTSSLHGNPFLFFFFHGLGNIILEIPKARGGHLFYHSVSIAIWPGGILV